MSIEPTAQALAGHLPLQVGRRYWLATRPMFLPASVLPVVLGTSWGARLAGGADWLAFVLALAAIVCVHAAVNVLNDVYDQVTDGINDGRIFPYTGGSRFIQNGVLSPRQMRHWAITLLLFAAALGGALLYLKGPVVLVFGAAGIVLGMLYSVPPVQLAARGMGEAAVGIGFGVLPVAGAVWLQSSVLDWAVLLLSLPVSFWAANILIVNEVPDAEADEAAGKRTLAVRFGRRGTAALYGASSLGAFVIIVGAAVRGMLPAWWAVPPAIALLGAGLWAAHGIARSPSLKASIELTLGIHALGTTGLALAAWV